MSKLFDELDAALTKVEAAKADVDRAAEALTQAQDRQAAAMNAAKDLREQVKAVIAESLGDERVR
jgi:hypothetical protein